MLSRGPTGLQVVDRPVTVVTTLSRIDCRTCAKGELHMFKIVTLALGLALLVPGPALADIKAFCDHKRQELALPFKFVADYEKNKPQMSLKERDRWRDEFQACQKLPREVKTRFGNIDEQGKTRWKCMKRVGFAPNTPKTLAASKQLEKTIKILTRAAPL